MDRDELPGYEFDAPHGPRQVSGRRPEFGHDSAYPPETGRGPVPWPDFGYGPASRPEAGRDLVPRSEFGRDVARRPGYISQPEFGRGLEPRSEFRGDLEPRSEFGSALAPQSEFWQDSIRGLRVPDPEPEPGPGASVRAAGSGVFNVMRKRNWLMGLAAPILAAIAVGIAVVVATGGGGTGGEAPSALAAGFPPARAAGASFTGSGRTSSQVTLTAIGASGATEVVAGGANGGPALWTSQDGGTDWARAVLRGPAPLAKAGTGQLAAVVTGPAGWLAVGTTLAGGGEPLVVSSPDARTWTIESGNAGLSRGNAAGAAAGPAGYVIVGHRSVGDAGTTVATAWYAPNLTGWQPAAIPASDDGAATMNAVTATARGFAAVGATGTSPAVWLSATGRTWQEVQVPTPADAARAALDYVAADGDTVVAAGTEFSVAGASSPFAEVSANAGATWTEVQLPVPDIGSGTGSTVTALTAAEGGFTAVGTYVTQAGPEVVIWTLPPGALVTNAAAWSPATPQGEGLASTTAENALTGLAADGATLTGVGFTAPLNASGTPQAQQPTLWQSPVRYLSTYPRGTPAYGRGFAPHRLRFHESDRFRYWGE